ncbi:MAG: VWA domain-containing protein [Deferrisomatales bacterium]
MFRFADPGWLALLAVLPALAYLRRRRPGPRLGVATAKGLEGIRPSFWVRTRWMVTALKGAGLTLMILALARPQWGSRETTRLTEGINLVLAVDTSESMAAIDFDLDGERVNRLAAVKAVVRDFVGRREGDRIGLVVFGSEAYTQLPLTTDYDTLLTVLERLEIGAAGPATAVGDAIGISVKRLEDVPSRSNVVILLTDGRSNSGELSPEAAAQAARELGVKVYTIGVGGRGEAPFRVEDPLFGRRVVYRRVDFDEATLRRVAETTGGEYFHAEGLEGLAEVYATIDRLEKSEVEVRTFDAFDDWYPCLLLPALGCLLAAAAAAATRYLEAV